MSPLAAVQRIYTRYQAIVDDTLYLADGRPRAIFELYPPNLALADDAALETAAQQLAVVFSGLRFPTMLLFRFVAIDLEAHAAAAERAGAERGVQLARAARDYAALERHLSRTRLLLELHVYLAFGLEGAPTTPLRNLLQASARLLSRRGGRANHLAGAAEQTQLLDERGEQVAVAFDAIGARPRRLNDVEIASLLYACWCPERSRREPLRLPREAA